MYEPSKDPALWAIAVIAVLFVIFGVLMVPDTIRQAEDKARCQSLGGVYSIRTCYVNGEEQ